MDWRGLVWGVLRAFNLAKEIDVGMCSAVMDYLPRSASTLTSLSIRWKSNLFWSQPLQYLSVVLRPIHLLGTC
jgi:hypothetical protein